MIVRVTYVNLLLLDHSQIYIIFKLMLLVGTVGQNITFLVTFVIDDYGRAIEVTHCCCRGDIFVTKEGRGDIVYLLCSSAFVASLLLSR